MVNETKANILATSVGVVIGAGAVIATVVAMKDKNNQKKLKDFVSSAKEMIDGYKTDASETMGDVKGKAKEVAGDVIKKAEQVTKTAKKEVKKI